MKKITNPHELVGKKVCDANGNTVGTIDKCWRSWNEDYPGWFFGIKLNDATRDTWFRGTNKLIPIYSDYIKEVTDHVVLNKTVEQLSRYWNRTAPLGERFHPIDELVDMPIYDKNNSRVGIFIGWVESEGMYKQYGCFVDPYLCDTWNLPPNTVMPLPPTYFDNARDAITLNKTLDELREYWQKNMTRK